MISLVAQRSFPYAGRTVLAAEHFEAQSVHDATVLKLGGLAVDAQLGVHAPETLNDDDPESPTIEKPSRRRRKIEIPA